MCPKLTEAHIYSLYSFQKMRVKLATQVYSRSVSVVLKTLVDLGKISSSPQVTLSTSVFFRKNPYRCALQKNNQVFSFLTDMVDYFKHLTANTKTKYFVLTAWFKH